MTISLTAREQQILDALLAEGFDNKELAVLFGISTETVKRHLASILNKTGYGTRLELAVKLLHQRYELAPESK